ncbi:MAG: DUF4115 domain-containing protein [Candidatus Andersenbacteria bacterium]
MVSGFFTRRILQVQSVGDILNGRRLALGIALERVARETQVQAKYLDAIERGDRNRLPAEIYVRGFVRTYARYLRLDEAVILEQWERERGIARHLANKEQAAQQAVRNGNTRIDPRKAFPERKRLLPRLKITPLVFRSGLVGLALLAGLLYLTIAVSSLGRRPALELSEPTHDITVKDSALVLVGETEPTARLSINGQPVQVTSDGHFRETVTLQGGMNQIKLVARSKLGRETEIVRNVQANLDPVAVRNDTHATQTGGTSSSTSQSDAVDKKGPVELTVEILDEATWISVDVDGESSFEGTLLPSSTKHFVGQDSVVLTSGKAEHTAVEFKGKKLTNLGEGFLRGITFTQDLDLNDLSTAAAL